MNEVGERLRRLRVARVGTQDQLCARAGVCKQTLCHIERGTVQHPHPDTLRRLALALDVPFEYLVGQGGAFVPRQELRTLVVTSVADAMIAALGGTEYVEPARARVRRWRDADLQQGGPS